MKKAWFSIVVFMALIHTVPGQPVSSRHYQLIAGTGTEAESPVDTGEMEALAREMESRFSVYTQLFRFDPARLSDPGGSLLKVRIIKDTGVYDSYVSSQLGGARPGAVYIHYQNPERRELVINRGGAEESRVLPYQAFVQYLRAFIPNPPSWLREGFAIYFTTLGYSPTGELEYKENLSWLETVKTMGNGVPPLEAILLADQGGEPENFRALSWALVSFFLNSGNEEYFRSLIESFMLLSPAADAAQNSQITTDHLGRWGDFTRMRTDFLSYLDSRKTFLEFMADGEAAHAAKDEFTAEYSFMSAMNQRPDHYAPYYYLGLLAYESGRHDQAEQYYRQSIENGADEALVLYALGINAITAGKNSDAVSFLRQAAELSPERYRARADDLIKRLGG
ncbi:MAG: tetratricopeptide repeat protein [Treponema sp.]|jgi:tetratricopeptide (TPR) repeat protein|nr:tetratricopeptide repeat protein [Treponema sp.]